MKTWNYEEYERQSAFLCESNQFRNENPNIHIFFAMIRTQFAFKETKSATMNIFRNFLFSF